MFNLDLMKRLKSADVPISYVCQMVGSLIANQNYSRQQKLTVANAALEGIENAQDDLNVIREALQTVIDECQTSNN